MKIHEFRAAAETREALFVVDSKTHMIKARPQNFLNRAIIWLREKNPFNPLARLERQAAHDHFLEAIAKHNGYDGSDLSRAKDLLKDDQNRGKPLSSRRIREVVERGSIPYSAVTQPRPEPLMNGGTRSSIVAVHSTWVSPMRIMHAPSACLVTPVSIETGRISFKSLPEGRIRYPFISVASQYRADCGFRNPD